MRWAGYAIHCPAGGLSLCLLSWAAATAVACQPAAPEAQRPDLLLITVDTLRADHLGSYGFPYDSSPNIDALAAQGVVFERAVAAASTTAPAHASIMTSRYVRGHTVGHRNGSTRLEDRITLAEILREASYRTGAFVGNLVLQRRVGLDRGFDEYDDDLPHSEPSRPGFRERRAGETTRRALEWLAQADTRPTFLWVHYQDPHGPYTAPRRYRDSVPIEVQRGEAPLPILPDDTGWRGIPAYQALPGLTRLSEYRRRYAEEIRFADHWVGRLVAAFDAAAGGRGTAVLLTADHGEAFGEHGFHMIHAYTSLPVLAHVPLVLRAPGIPPGRRAEIVSHVDVMPTLLELAGLDPPVDAAGVALGPRLRDAAAWPDRFVYCDIGIQLSAYRDERVVHVLDADGPWGEVLAEGRDPARLEPRWLAYPWPRGGPASLAYAPPPGSAESVASAERAAVERYLRRTTPMRPAPALVSGEREGLRALGYVVD